MGPFDEDFLERVFDDTRMPVGYQGAQQLLKPSGVLWPNLVETSSRASNATSKHLSRKIFYASTKVRLFAISPTQAYGIVRIYRTSKKSYARKLENILRENSVSISV